MKGLETVDVLVLAALGTSLAYAAYTVRYGIKAFREPFKKKENREFARLEQKEYQESFIATD